MNKIHKTFIAFMMVCFFAGAIAKPKLLMNEYQHAKLAIVRAKALIQLLEEEKE